MTPGRNTATTKQKNQKKMGSERDKPLDFSAKTSTMEVECIKYTKEADMEKYKFAAVAVDLAIFSIKDNTLRVLLVDMDKDPYKGRQALHGSLIRPDEGLDQAVSRLLDYNMAVHTEQLYTFGDTDRDPSGRVVSAAYLVLATEQQARSIKEAVQKASQKRTGWHDIDKAQALPLAYDHAQILDTAVTRLRSKIRYTNIIQALMPQEFTMARLQHSYEAVLGQRIDKRNFIKHINHYGLLKEAGKTAHSQQDKRTPKVYRFKHRGITILKKF